MTTSMPSSPVYLSPPSSPLTRQIASPDAGFVSCRSLYWNRQELPFLFSEAVAFEREGPLTLTGAKDALRTAWSLQPTLSLCVRKPRGYTFHIYFGTPTGSSPPVTSLGVTIEDALEYVACDYIRHRYLGDLLRIPLEFRPHDWNAVCSAIQIHACKLHSRIFCGIIDLCKE